MRTWRNARFCRRQLERDASALGRFYRAARRVGFPGFAVAGEEPFTIAAAGARWTFLLVADAAALTRAQARNRPARRASATEEED